MLLVKFGTKNSFKFAVIYLISNKINWLPGNFINRHFLIVNIIVFTNMTLEQGFVRYILKILNFNFL